MDIAAIDWDFVGYVTILVIVPPLMWLLRGRLANWPADEIDSPRARVVVRWSLWAFMWALVIFGGTMVGQRYGLFAPDALLILKIIVGVLFVGASIPLGWYRMARKWD